MGNFSGNIISKILANRLAGLLPKIIHEQQAGYVHGRNISTHISLAQELVRELSRKVYRANVVFKLDMVKAYDRLEWRFLLRAMESFGFSAKDRDLIHMNIGNIGYQFRINREITGRFSSIKGVRQGDPPSPLLFVLAQQILTVNLKARISKGLIIDYKVGRGDISLSLIYYIQMMSLFLPTGPKSLCRIL